MQLLADRVLIKPIPVKPKSLFGIELPKFMQKESYSGIVVGTGRGTEKRPMQYKVGQTIHHIKGAGIEVIEDGVQLFIIADIDILAFSNN
jgi:co-chaperonin GroES (HSP10)